MASEWKYGTKTVNIDLGKGRFLEGKSPIAQSDIGTLIVENGGDSDVINYNYISSVNNVDFEFWVTRKVDAVSNKRRVGLSEALSRLSNEPRAAEITLDFIYRLSIDIEEGLGCISKHDERKNPSISSVGLLIFEVSAWEHWPQIKGEVEFGRYV